MRRWKDEQTTRKRCASAASTRAAPAAWIDDATRCDVLRLERLATDYSARSVGGVAARWLVPTPSSVGARCFERSSREADPRRTARYTVAACTVKRDDKLRVLQSAAAAQTGIKEDRWLLLYQGRTGSFEILPEDEKVGGLLALDGLDKSIVACELAPAHVMPPTDEELALAGAQIVAYNPGAVGPGGAAVARTDGTARLSTAAHDASGTASGGYAEQAQALAMALSLAPSYLPSVPRLPACAERVTCLVTHWATAEDNGIDSEAAKSSSRWLWDAASVDAKALRLHSESIDDAPPTCISLPRAASAAQLRACAARAVLPLMQVDKFSTWLRLQLARERRLRTTAAGTVAACKFQATAEMTCYCASGKPPTPAIGAMHTDTAKSKVDLLLEAYMRDKAGGETCKFQSTGELSCCCACGAPQTWIQAIGAMPTYTAKSEVELRLESYLGRNVGAATRSLAASSSGACGAGADAAANMLPLAAEDRGGSCSSDRDTDAEVMLDVVASCSITLSDAVLLRELARRLPLAVMIGKDGVTWLPTFTDAEEGHYPADAVGKAFAAPAACSAPAIAEAGYGYGTIPGTARSLRLDDALPRPTAEETGEAISPAAASARAGTDMPRLPAASATASIVRLCIFWRGAWAALFDASRARTADSVETAVKAAWRIGISPSGGAAFTPHWHATVKL